MKIPNNELQKAYFDALNGVITVPLYDSVPRDAPNKYAVISSFDNIEDTDKTALGMSVAMDMDVFCKYSVGWNGGTKELHEICNEITTLVRTRFDYFDLGINFNLYRLIIDNMRVFKEITSEHIVYHAVITFSHLIEEI